VGKLREGKLRRRRTAEDAEDKLVMRSRWKIKL
jgi:hypothetical protein